MNAKQHEGGDRLKDLGSDEAKAMLTTGSGEDIGAGADDDQEGGTTGAASMTGGDASGARSPDAQAPNDARPGGQWGGAAAADQGEIGMSSATPGPMGAGGGGQGGAGGSHGTGSYNQAGNLTGPDSPAGDLGQGDPGDEDAAEESWGQGDDLANRLGGGEGRGTGMSGAGAVSGDMSAGRSEGGGSVGSAPDAGAPGGMGGVRGSGKTAGGVSPILTDEERGEG